MPMFGVTARNHPTAISDMAEFFGKQPMLSESVFFSTLILDMWLQHLYRKR